MTTNSNRGAAVYREYCASQKYNLRDAYKSWSYEKEKAWKHCVDLCTEYNGESLKILGANTFNFSAGFTFKKEEKTYLMYITVSGHKAIEVKE